MRITAHLLCLAASLAAAPAFAQVAKDSGPVSSAPQTLSTSRQALTSSTEAPSPSLNLGLGLRKGGTERTLLPLAPIQKDELALTWQPASKWGLTGFSHALHAELRGGGSKHRPVSDPLCTVVANGNHHGLVTAFYGKGLGTRPTEDALATVTTTERHALLMRNNTPRNSSSSKMPELSAMAMAGSIKRHGFRPWIR